MKFVLWLEILTMLGYYGLMAVGFNQAILGHWGLVVIIIMTLGFITLAGFAPIPGRWGEIPATMVLSRKGVWRFANPEFKEEYFLDLALHCISGDYNRHYRQLLDKHKITSAVFYKVLLDYYQGRMNLIHNNWEEIAKQTFVTYGSVDRVQVYNVQQQFDDLTPDGMIAAFMDNLSENNLDLIIENYLFYNFIHKG